MRAIALTEPGAEPTLTELPLPEPGAGEVLVRVAGSSLNGFDVSVAAGYVMEMMEHRFPVVPGMDFSGTVVVTGGDTTRFGSGDRVFGVVRKPYVGDGGLAEYVVVDEQSGVTALPAGVDEATAGALGLAGVAALDALDAVALQPGDTVLISGATGGVGAIAVQYAAAAGAHVIATTGSDAAAEFVRSLGADDVVNHTGELASQIRALRPDGVDAVLHLAGDGGELARLLTENGRLASTLGFGPDQHPSAVSIMANPTKVTLDRLAQDVAAGRVRVPISRTYELADAPAAFADFTAGALGKLAITVA